MTNDDSVIIRKVEGHAGRVNHSVLSEEERTHAQRVLSETEFHIARSSKRLTGFPLFLHKYRQRAERFRIALAPHKRLPPEILSEIFVYCLESHANRRDISARPAEDIPMLLGDVCVHWRDVALREPRLWKRAVQMNITAPGQLTRACSSLPPYVTFNLHASLTIDDYEQLWRSTSPALLTNLHTATLEVTGLRSNGILRDLLKEKRLRRKSSEPFTLARHLDDLTVDATHSRMFLDQLLNVIPWHQLRYLSLIGPDFLISDVLKILQQCSMLWDLSLSCNKLNTSVSDGASNPNLVSLESFTLEKLARFPRQMLFWDHLWDRISTLNLENMRLSGTLLQIVLSQCPRLRALSLVDPQGKMDPAIDLLELQTLAIKKIKRAIFVCMIRAPSISHLTLQYDTADNLTLFLSVAMILIFLGASQSSLSSLVVELPIDLFGLSAALFYEFLTAVPNLTHLDFPNTSIDDYILEKITGGTLLRHLQDIRCVFRSNTQILAMLEARAQQRLLHVQVLRHAVLRVHNPESTPSAEVTALRKKLQDISHNYRVDFSAVEVA